MSTISKVRYRKSSLLFPTIVKRCVKRRVKCGSEGNGAQFAGTVRSLRSRIEIHFGWPRQKGNLRKHHRRSVDCRKRSKSNVFVFLSRNTTEIVTRIDFFAYWDKCSIFRVALYRTTVVYRIQRSNDFTLYTSGFSVVAKIRLHICSTIDLIQNKADLFYKHKT